MLLYEGFHVLGELIVKNVALWGDAGRSDSVEEGDVSSLHLSVSPVLHWGN